MPATEAVLMITPRVLNSSSGSVLAIAAAPIRMPLKVPIRLTSMTFLYEARSCGEPSRPTVRDAHPMPALFTTTRSGAPVATAASTAACTWASSETSTLTNTPPISSARVLPRSSLRSAMTTLAPCPARSRAVASPSPLAPPVTIAAAPFTSMSRGYPSRPNHIRVTSITLRSVDELDVRGVSVPGREQAGGASVTGEVDPQPAVSAPGPHLVPGVRRGGGEPRGGGRHREHDAASADHIGAVVRRRRGRPRGRRGGGGRRHGGGVDGRRRARLRRGAHGRLWADDGPGGGRLAEDRVVQHRTRAEPDEQHGERGGATPYSHICRHTPHQCHRAP